jgi:hypothetical protein
MERASEESSMPFQSRPLASGIFALAALAAQPVQAQPSQAGFPDWASLAEVEVIEVLTRDADGAARETKVWFVLVDDAPYLRTSRSRWLENLRRDPNLRLRINDREYAARAEEIPGGEIVDQVDSASVEKYGWQQRFVRFFRIRKPEILRLWPVADRTP